MNSKKILLATNLSLSHFAVKLANLLCEGLKGIEIYPEFVSEISHENVCIVAYVGEMPKDVLEFIKKHETKQIIIYLDHAASKLLGEQMSELDSFIIRDDAILVVKEVWDFLEFLLKET